MSMQIQKPMNYLNFIVICLILRLRDVIYPPKYVLNDVEITPGDTVLDFGCGPVNYTIPVAEKLDDDGKIIAIDYNPDALKKVEKKAKKNEITNIKTINSDCETGLPSNSVDVILLYYVFNDLENPDKVLHELYRVLKTQGILSLSEYNIRKISPKLEKKAFFEIQKKNELTHTFVKIF
ncbi:MAG: class I SAM-dependent methyltransferase [Nitrosopumilaceae archaeon]